MKKFEVGQKYIHFSWFTGGRILYEVDGVRDGKVILATEDHELDGVHRWTESNDIRTDTDGNEYIVLFAYHGEECRIYAKGENNAD